MTTVAKLLKHDFAKGSLNLFDSNGSETYFENSNGIIRENRPKTKCDGKTVIIDGIKYKLKAKK